MSEFCVKCSEKEAEIEILRKRYHDEFQCMKAKIEKLQNENEALAMDVAFYNGSLNNLTNNTQ